MRSSPLSLALCLAAATAACTTQAQPEGHNGGTLTGDNTWVATTHNVNGTITISSGTLTVAAGATLLMASGSDHTSIIVGKGGTLKMLGTQDKPITITSNAPAPNRGDWGNIDFQEGSGSDNIITNANISFGGASDTFSDNGLGTVMVEAGAAAEISNTVIDNSSTYGMAIPGDATLNNFVGNYLVHNTQGAMTVTANTAGQIGPGVYGPNDSNGITLLESQLTQNANWINTGTPWIIKGLTIQTLQGTAILTVAAGNTFLMAQNTGIIVQKNGALNLAGTAAAPIVITSAQNPAARGDWYDISYYIASIAGQNAMTYTEVDFGGGNQKGAVWLEAGAQLAMSNSTVANSSGVGVTVTAGGQLPNFSNNSLIHNAQGPISIDVDDVRQLQGLTNTYGPNTVDGIQVNGSNLSTSTHWGPIGYWYTINQVFAVDKNIVTGTGLATWTVDPGTTIRLASGIAINVQINGQIQVLGTTTSPVLFTSTDPTISWDHLFLNSLGNLLQNVQFRYSGSTGKCGVYLGLGSKDSRGATDPNYATITATNVNFAESASISMCGYVDCAQQQYDWIGDSSGQPVGDPTRHCN